MSFVHLHNHTDFSFLDGSCKVDDLCAEAARMGMPAVAITDHGNLCGAVDFYRAAQRYGVKPIIGCELYLTAGSRTDRGKDEFGRERPIYHLLLIAKNMVGWKNLMKLSTAGYLEGFYRKPRVDYELLERHREGLICLSGCLQSHLNQTLLLKGEEEAVKVAGRFQDLFGEDFYLELQDHGLSEEKAFDRFHVQLAKKINAKLVATNDTHYLKKEHADPHDVLLCVQTHTDRSVPKEKRFHFTGEEFYLKSEEEMAGLFGEVPEALSNTLEVAEKVDVEISFGEKHFPSFPLPDSVADYDSYLRELCEQGLPKRYGDVSSEVRARLEHELKVIREKNLASYLLIVRDFIRHAREEGIPVGPGRGSAAGSLVSYLIGITNIDPIRYGLLFERFINPERESYPDIDVDFSDTRRGEVIEYVRRKYGEDNVCQIITFGRMLSRQAIKDVGRVLNVSLPEVEAITKLIPEGPSANMKKVTLKKSLEESRELRELVKSRKEYTELIDKAIVLEGTIRNAGVHAAGVVITPEPLTELVPLYKSPDGEVTTQFDMNNVERLGLLKVDFLGLKTLSILERALELLHKRGVELHLEDIPLDDAATYELFARGDTIGIFQFESGGMRDSLRKLRPTRLEDLIAMNALYRPGPMENIGEFVKRKHGQNEITHLHPSLAEILDETYGIIVYQEQVMQIANRLAGMSLGRADILRRAMGKKKQKLMDELMPEFMEGCGKNGIDKATARKLWDLIERFAKYGFNKSHAAGYALVAYQTGYLKTHYPAEFMAASMTVRKDRTDELILFLEECRRMGIEVLPPDVNASEEDFTVTDSKAVRFGLGAIKNVGSAAISHILGEREAGGPYADLFDLASRVNGRLVNRKVLENLILAGATVSLEGNRRQQIEALDRAMAYAQQMQLERARGQVSIFGEEEGMVSLPRPPLPEVEEMPTHELLAYERDLLGFYFSGHPLLRFRREAEALSSFNVTDLGDARDDQSVRIAALFCSLENRQTRKGDLMARGRFEDLTGLVGVVIFPKTFEKLRHKLNEDEPMLLSGRVQRRDAQIELIVEDVEPLEQAAARLTRGVEMVVGEEVSGKVVIGLEQELRSHPGDVPLRIVFLTDEGDRLELASKRYKVKPDRELLDRAEKLLGEGKVRLEAVG